MDSWNFIFAVSCLNLIISSIQTIIINWRIHLVLRKNILDDADLSPAELWKSQREVGAMMKKLNWCWDTLFHFDGWSKTDFYTINPNLEHINRVKYLSRRNFSPKTSWFSVSGLIRSLIRGLIPSWSLVKGVLASRSLVRVALLSYTGFESFFTWFKIKI